MTRLLKRYSLVICGAALFAVPVFAQDAQLPEGPYQLRNIDLYYVIVSFNPAAVDAILPDNLQAADGYTGGIGVYTVTEGWGVAPFTAGYIYIDLKGQDAPGGAAGRYVLAGYYSDPAFTLLAPSFPTVMPGEGRIETDGGDIVATVGSGGADLFRIRMVQPDIAGCFPGVSGVNHYLSGPVTAADQMMVIPYVGDYCPTTPVSVEILPSAGPVLAGLAPETVTGAYGSTKTALVLGLFEPLQ